LFFERAEVNMGERLLGKVAVITGAATGIGKASALLFAQEGASVVLIDIDRDHGEEVAEQIRTSEGRASFIRADVSRTEDVRTLVSSVVDLEGKIDVLFNNAAINYFGKITDTAEDDWDRVMNVNVRGVFLGCKYVIPVMQKSGGGSIINTASAAAIVGLKNLAAYTASKGAVLQLTKNLALDYAADGIRVNALCPGVTATEMTLKLIDESPDPSAARRRFDTARPIGRMGEPLEIAKAALFLASDDSSYMTGAHLLVDGGYCAE
jgi:NAD(P)-dependent dehydrogenase (short-subunit alcohol dehydrogenase family)